MESLSVLSPSDSVSRWELEDLKREFDFKLQDLKAELELERLRRNDRVRGIVTAVVIAALLAGNALLDLFVFQAG